MEEYNNENVEYCEATYVDEPCEDCGSERKSFGLLKGVLGLGVIAAGAAIGYVVKSGKFNDFKAKRKEKKIAKLEAKLEKEYYTLPSGDSEVEKETEKETVECK